MAEAPIFHLCPRRAWRAAAARGAYHGSPGERADGFIHFSSAAQLAASAARHYRGVDGLVLLRVDPTALGAALKWEPSRGGAQFPHLYGPLPTTAVLAADDVALDADGRHVLPPDIPPAPA